MRLTPAVVLGLNPNGLGLVKSLRAAGIPDTAVDYSPRDWSDTHTWMSCRTRLCRRILLDRPHEPERMVSTLLELAEEAGAPLPVFPSGDLSLYNLVRHRDQLGDRIRFHAPPAATLDLLMQKGQFYDFCVENGILAPITLRHASAADLSDSTVGVRFPCIVKPGFRDGRWDGQYALRKALIAKHEGELKPLVEEATPFADEILVQEMIPGPDSQLFFSHGYFLENGETAAMWTGRKLRQHPVGLGTSTLVETLHVPEVARITEKVARALGIRGYLNAEFKHDPRDGTYRLLEVTPCRTWYPHYLGKTANINIPEIWYRDLMGLSLPPRAPGPPPDRIAWVDEYRDFIVGLESWRRGELGLGEWMSSYLSVRSFALFSLRDPLPGLFVLARLGISMKNILARRLRPQR